MRVTLTRLCSTLLGLVLSMSAFAQLTGTKNIPGDYADLATAITTLNSQGVGAGGVIFNVNAAQTAPAGGYIITATGTAANQIAFQGSNNIITASAALVVGNLTDALFTIGGGDYITINNFQLRDNAANVVFATAATNTMTEFGVVLARATTTDGAQNNTISNCTITLRQGGAYTNTFGIYSNARHNYNAVYTTAVANAAGGENSNNTYRNNTISGVLSGIVIIGDATTVDVNNTVGGSSGQGNNITLSTNTTGALTTYAGYVTTRMDGIFLQNAQACNVNYNTVVCTGSTLSSTGIYLSGSAGAAAYTNNTNNNNVTINSAGTGTYYAIWNSAGNAAATQNTNNNTISINTAGTTYGVYLGQINLVNNVNSNNITVVNTGTGTVAAVYNSIANSSLNETGNTFNVSVTGTTSGTNYFCYNSSTHPTALNITGNTFASTSGLNSTGTTYMIYQSSGTPSANISNNVTSGTITKTSASGTFYMYYNFGSPTPAGGMETDNNNNFSNIVCSGTTIFYGWRNSTLATHNKTINGNVFNNITLGSGTSAILTTDYMNNLSVANNNKINNVSATGSVYGFNFGYGSTLGGTGIGTGGYFTGNKITNISSSGASAVVTAIFMSPASTGFMVFNNDTVINASASGTTAPIVRGIHMFSGTNDSLMNCYVSGITTTAGAGSAVVNGITIGGGTITNPSAFNNNVNDISSGTSAGTTTQSIGVSITGGTTSVNVYNTFISNIVAPSASNANAVVGINVANTGTINNRIFFNTIKIGATGTPVTSTGTDFGVAGLLYPNTATVTNNVKNNIININGTAAGTGVVAAVRRNAIGTANTLPGNFSGGSNIYYTNTGANNYLVVEGTLNTNVVNGYATSGLTASVPNNIVNDVNFNTACGAYKAFMGGAENSTTTENNIVAGAITGTFNPSGASFAESGGVAITTPSITFDFSNVIRTAVPDIGAKEFAGTATDVAAPSIVYTALGNTFCTSNPTVVATITDGTGVNLTTGTRPRLYYKKTTETNAFGTYPANNVSTFNGWKYVESTNSGTTHTFVLNYALLTAAVVNGETIQYFIAAQDVATTPNVGFNVVGLATGYCASSVNLPPAAGPTLAAPVINNYAISTIPVFTATATQDNLCVSGSTTITLTPAVLTGSTIQWQHDNNTGTYINIPAATGVTYVTPTITSTDKYRAQIYCGVSVVATSVPDTVNVNNPQILTTTGDTICPNTPATLAATAPVGNTINWYAALTGGTALATGPTYTTPNLAGNTTYYVGATAGGGSGNVGKTAYTSTDGTNTGGYLIFNATVPFTLFNVTIYPYSATNGTAGTVTILLQNSAGTTLQTAVIPVTGYNTPVAQTATLNFNVPIGTSMRLTYGSVTGVSAMYREYSASAGITFPYTLPGIVSITDGSLAGYYYFFYNWSVSAGCDGVRVPVTATVTSPPTATVTSTDTICQGSAGNVNVAFTGYGPWNFTYTNGVTPVSVTGITANPYTFSVTPPAPNTSYSLTALSDNICAAASNTLTSSAILDTYPQPTASLGGTQTICNGSPAFIFLNLTGAGPWTYTYTNGITPVTQTTGNTANNISVSPSTTTSYSIIAMNDIHCTATPANITNNAIVSVNSRPTATLATVPGSDTACSGAAANIEMTFTGSAPWIFEYTDGTNSYPVNTSSNPYVATVNPTSTTTYSLNYLIDNNCASIPPDFASTATVTVVPGPSIVTQPVDANECSNHATSFTVAANGWGATYQWYENNVALTDVGVYSGTGTGTLSISNITGLNGNDYYAIVTGNCSPTVTSDTVTITEGFSTVWNGAVNDLWSNPLNWSCGSVPNQYMAVTIPSGATNMPKVDIPTAVCQTLTIANSASIMFVNAGSELQVLGNVSNNGSFDVNAAGLLSVAGNIANTGSFNITAAGVVDVSGDITNIGTFTAAGGSVVLSGTGSQNIPGATYDEIHVLGGSSKTIAGAVTINNALELNSGYLNLGNNNLMLGTATVTGGSPASFIATTGTGAVKVNNMGTGGNTGSVIFHVGSGSYTPVTLMNEGTLDNYSVRVMPNVYIDGDGTNPATVNNPVVNRTWMVSEDVQGGSMVTMTPQWNAAEHINAFDLTHVFVAHYMGNEWTNYLNGTPSASAPPAVGTDPYTITQDSITSLSPFTVASTGGFPLAITIRDISATNVKDKNRVNWSTSTEAFGDKFEIEQSADAKTFTVIGNQNANGIPSKYTFWDNNPYEGVTYYRVKLLSGNSGTYTKIVSAIMKIGNNFSLSAYPNPVTDKVNVKVDGNVSGVAAILVTDATGKVVRKVTVNNNNAEIDMNGLATGMYMIIYNDDLNHGESIKINKQ